VITGRQQQVSVGRQTMLAAAHTDLAVAAASQANGEKASISRVNEKYFRKKKRDLSSRGFLCV